MPSKPPDPPGRKPGAPVRQDLTPLNSRADLFTDSVVTIDPATKERMKQAAPEVSQGHWRERAIKPRGTMTRDDVEVGMRGALREACRSPGKLPELCASLKADWLPFFRQVVEQTGGDGLDALLSGLLNRPARAPWKDPVLSSLIGEYRALNRATTLAELTTAAELVIGASLRAMDVPEKHRISFKVLERELEGRLELDELLSLMTATDIQLEVRMKHVRETLDSLRDDIRRGIPGQQPNGMLWNFTRFKAERIVIEAEQRRRKSAPAT